MNAVEKILAAHAGKEEVRPGEIIDVELDYVMANDACTGLAIDIFEKKLRAEKLFDPEKIVLVLDHYTPSSSIEAADSHNKIRRFAQKHALRHLYDGDGICHQLMLEKHVQPGQLIIGADSHTCSYGALGALATGMGSTDIAVAWQEGKTWMKVPQSIKVVAHGRWPDKVHAKDFILEVIKQITVRGATYKALCFEGEAIEALSIPGRVTVANMAIEAGAKFAFIPSDALTRQAMEQMGRTRYATYADDEDASYCQVLEIDVEQIAPKIACPHKVDKVKDVDSVSDVALNEIFLGGCTNGSFEDLQVAASILEGKKIAKSVRMLVTPASRDIYLQAMESGLLKIFMDSGAMVNHPGCSACFGGSGGILGDKEILLSTANRNFKARAGSATSQIYLASPATIAASAITGKITDPREVIT